MVKNCTVSPDSPDTCDVRVIHLERVARARKEAIAEKGCGPAGEDV